MVEGEEPPSEYENGEEEGDGSGEYVDEEEVENAIVNGTPSAAATTTTGGGMSVREAGQIAGSGPKAESVESEQPSRIGNRHGPKLPFAPPRGKYNTPIVTGG